MGDPGNEAKLKLLKHAAVRRAEIVFLQPASTPGHKSASIPVGVNVLFLSFSQLQLHAVAVQRFLKKLVHQSMFKVKSEFVVPVFEDPFSFILNIVPSPSHQCL